MATPQFLKRIYFIKYYFFNQLFKHDFKK